MSNPVRETRRRLREDHGSIVATVDCCADAVAEPWDTARTTNRDALVDEFRSELETAGVLEEFPAVLEDAVDATGYELQAQPIPGPPYVVVTSRGPMLRATIDPGRLVIRFDAFEVVRTDRGASYRRRDGVELVVALE
ncbi:hypothetical protein [Natronobacterium gregoryi]|uniref:DUF7988 domain-containing protein n=2 Tax=Natronobacterium gregoryi TaxID=44930 RepID=L0AMQ8_NATGS|nr:hypothetical protein [Natronobacterium gregoryi]AFZ74355.1 hypothetical protein Natgr_3225 [Natronobacterium gregoryi SP2]ELY63453.1 hypothetical protein C490_16274 [Natronobacterium gregoryi SP2]PLK22135.1 hypothetical protein CYV19_00200 [Natronobacterium gregoryi SP2]SFI54342.1 hypothetical protein SAMN05443661_101245 [Natronobacterium gregoryi]